MKKNKIIWIGLAAVFTGVVGFFVYDLKKKSKQQANDSNDYSEELPDTTWQPPISETISSSNSLSSTSFPLKNGSKGSQVAVLQKWLNSNGYASPILVTDGIFGSKTLAAVKKMQEYPNEKFILDYNNKMMWQKGYTPGEITLDFYQIFVTKTKPRPTI